MLKRYLSLPSIQRMYFRIEDPHCRYYHTIFIQDNLFSKDVTAINKGPVQIKILSKRIKLTSDRVKNSKKLLTISF